jgi:benzil reductase ((S)-benzoin forming)
MNGIFTDGDVIRYQIRSFRAARENFNRSRPIVNEPDKLAIVTGTSSGVGAAVARELIEHGWAVIGIARRDAPIASQYYDHVYQDLADVNALVRTMEKTIAPRLQVNGLARVALVNNAATGSLLSPVQNLDAVQLLEVYAINAAAPTWLMGFVSRHTPAGAALRIVNVSSAAAVHPSPGLAAYGSSKAALRLAGMVLAEEWRSPAPHAPSRANAAILSYEPGTVDTPMQAQARSMSPEHFPWVGMFQNFARSGLLAPPDQPAAEIVRWVESERQPPFAERRFER